MTIVKPPYTRCDIEKRKMNSENSPHVFLSYSQLDASVAARVQQELAAAQVNVWIDLEQIKPGDSFLEKMNQGLTAAAYVVLLCSPASLSSRWVTREWMSSLARRDTVLLPVKIADVEMPALLTDMLYIDCSEDFARGMRRLVTFLKEEQQSPAKLAPRVGFRGGSADSPQAGISDPVFPGSLCNAELHEIRKVAKRCVDGVALKEYLFDMGIDTGSLKGDSLHEQLINLLHTLSRDEQLVEFSNWLEAERKTCVQAHLKKLRTG